MPKYSVEIRYVGVYETEMEADNMDDAMEYAQEDLGYEINLSEVDLELSAVEIED